MSATLHHRRSGTPASAATPPVAKTTPALAAVAAAARIGFGFVFLWAFLDKTFGLGFATERADAWIKGGSPTAGFLGHGTKGPFADFYQGLAGSTFVDWVFMLGLLGIGLALILGIGMRVATVSAVAMLLMMWTATLWPENNPVIDDHIMYAVSIVVLTLIGAGKAYGLGEKWEELPFVQRNGWLK